MAQEHFIYAVTRVHMHEQNLLSDADIAQMVDAPSTAAVLQMLADKGWPVQPGDAANPAPLLARYGSEAWALMHELVGNAPEFDVLRISADYHNLKAAIKLTYTAGDVAQPAYYLQGGNMDIALLQQAAVTHDFSHLPQGMAQAGQQAYETLAQTANGQLCDIVIDRACLLTLQQAAAESNSQLLQQYANLTIDIANIKAAIRCCHMHKALAFTEMAVVPAGSLASQTLIQAAATGENAIYAYLRTTPYAGAVDALQQSMAAFETWANNYMMQAIRPQRLRYESIEPLVAYILARENEIAMVRVILTAKMNAMGKDILHERMRAMYV